MINGSEYTKERIYERERGEKRGLAPVRMLREDSNHSNPSQCMRMRMRILYAQGKDSGGLGVSVPWAMHMLIDYRCHCVLSVTHSSEDLGSRMLE